MQGTYNLHTVRAQSMRQVNPILPTIPRPRGTARQEGLLSRSLRLTTADLLIRNIRGGLNDSGAGLSTSKKKSRNPHITVLISNSLSTTLLIIIL
jgi:hypothetical protein